MFKKLTLLSLFILMVFLYPVSTGAEVKTSLKDEQGIVYIFTSPTCPHCAAAKNFLIDLEKEGQVEFTYKEYTISDNIALVREFYAEYDVPNNERGLVPAIFVGDRFFIGYSDDIGRQIEAQLIAQTTNQENGTDQNALVNNEEKRRLVNIPFLGEVDLLSLSLPILAITLGITDGFNVCSIGALVIILGLVMILKSRKRIFLMGGVFILTTGLVYGALIVLWHQLFTLIAPFMRSMEVFIGILSLVGGLYLLREFYKAYKNGPVCSTNNIMSRLTPRVEKIFKNKTNLSVLLGTVFVFAFFVTLIEFPCSAALPVLFTSILVESGISTNASLGYIGLFLSFYLLDELIIFTIAVLTMKIKIVSSKFIIFFNLLAAAIFIFIGIYYIFGILS